MLKLGGQGACSPRKFGCSVEFGNLSVTKWHKSLGILAQDYIDDIAKVCDNRIGA